MRGLFAVALVALAVALPRASAAETSAEADPRERAQTIARELADLRGAAAGEPMSVVVLSQRELCDRLAGFASRRAVSAPARRRALAAFGLAGPAGAGASGDDELDLARARRGYYDPRAGRVYVARGASTGGGALAHAVARAAQDRRVDRGAFLRAADTTDEHLARLAILEGSTAALVIERAMLRSGVGILWGHAPVDAIVRSLGTVAGPSPGRVSGLSVAARERALFPYREGLAFVGRLRRHEPWSRIDALYDKPPLSTSHILHPRRYRRYERPERIDGGGVELGGLYRRVHRDVVGELGLRTWLLAHGVPRARAERAADGWRGDRLEVHGAPALLSGAWPDVAVSFSSWRTEVDAVEFFEAAAIALAGIAGGPRVPEPDRLVYRTASGTVSWLERRGSAVAVALGAPPDRADGLRESVWATWRAPRGSVRRLSSPRRETGRGR